MSAPTPELVPSGACRGLVALAGVHAALARLRRAGPAAGLIRLAPEEACRCLGYERAVLFRVDGEALVAESAHHRAGTEATAELLERRRAAPPALDQLPYESEMIRRREPLLLGDPRGPLNDVAGTRRDYVAAPIVSEGRVVGFLHADRGGGREPLDELDQLALSAFAEGLACAFERATLRERLRAQFTHVREVMATTDQLLDEVIETEVEVGIMERRSSSSIVEAASALAEPAGGAGPERVQLTQREVEVIELIATGETNRGIAERLLISESTVKSHVKHILRKLGAGHRAEAVSRYLAARPR